MITVRRLLRAARRHIMAISDEYVLQASDTLTLSGRQELSHPFLLVRAASGSSGTVKGQVFTSAGDPVSSATVKLFDARANPLYHTRTDPSGFYTFYGIPDGSYLCAVSKDGYLIPDLKSVTVQGTQTGAVDFVMDLRTDNQLAVLYGKITQTNTVTPISGVSVHVFSDTDGQLLLTTATNDTGEFLAPGLAPGLTYHVQAAKEGFSARQSDPFTLSIGELHQLNLQLSVLAADLTGTISGIVLDAETRLPVAGAAVALYVVSGENESILYTALTNSEGLYLFGSLPQGNYLVKAVRQTGA